MNILKIVVDKKNALSWNTERRDEIFAKHLLIRILIFPSSTWLGQQKHRGTAVLNRASSNSEILHCLLKPIAQDGPQALGVSAWLKLAFTVISSWRCLRNPMLRKHWFGFFLGYRNHIIRPLTKNLIPNAFLLRNWDGLSPSSQNTENGGAAVPSPACSTYSGSRSIPFYNMSAESETTSVIFKVSPNQQM